MKFRLFLVSAIAGLFLGSCVVKEIPSGEGTVKAVMENDKTRTSVTDEGSFTWSAGDQVWLNTTAGGVVGTLSSGAGTASANFDYGAFFGEMTGEAVYPYNSGHSISGDELDVVLPASYDLGDNLSNTNAAMYGENINGKIMFNHLAGVMRFKFRNVPAGTDRFQLTLDKKINGVFSADLTADYPVLQTEDTDVAAEKTITLNFDALTKASDIALYVPLPLGTYETLALDLWAGDQSVWTYSNTVINTVDRKSLILMPAVNMGGSVDGEIDDDYYSESDEPVDLDLSESGYANSYIVSAAGTYRFRPTKGSSLKFIKNISSVEVYWESFGTDVAPSVGDLIRNPKYEDGFISFETPEILKEGNAVIVARNANGTILWSWHIWLTDKPQEYICVDDAGITMDRNLGATSAVPGEVGALGLMYEWGRKDPFLGSSSIDEPKVAKATNTWFSVSCSDSSTGSIDFSIKNPMTFISEGYYNDWLYYDNYNQIDYTRWDEVKTIYDPCPSGWKVPDMTFYYNAKFHTEANQSDTDKCGRKFSGSGEEIWFPNTGQLTSNDSFMYFNYGLYWTSTAPQGNTSAWIDSFYFSSTYVDYDGMFEAGRAQAVRCVKDQSSVVTGDLPESSYAVTLSPSSSAYGWKKSSSVSNPNYSLYEGVYESTNQGIHNSCSLMYIDIVGYETFKLYVRSYAESSYDFVVVSELDATLTQSTISGLSVKMTTRSNQSSNTSINGYTLVEFTGIDYGQHRITVMYRKDTSTNSNDDKGYLLIPKDQ